METIRGRRSLVVDFIGLKDRLADYNRIMLDLGTGDGRYVYTLAGERPDWFVIGIDSSRENLREYSQAKLQNMLFVIASAQSLPAELNGFISHLSINFPWGSLLESLLTGDSKLMRGLESVSHSATSIDLYLNGGALVEAGTTLETGAEKIYDHLIQSGWQLRRPVMLNDIVLKSFPTTWARRLAHGRDPRTIRLSGTLTN